MTDRVFISIRHEGGAVSRMQFFTRKKPAGLSVEAAIKHGFKPSDGEWVREATPELVEAEIARAKFPKDVGRVIGWRIVKPKDFPADDGEFKGARRDDGKSITLDMTVCRQIHMDRIRRVRNRRLKKLDELQMRGDDVAKEKQALRDLPQTFDLSKAQTSEELKALWPAELSSDFVPSGN